MLTIFFMTICNDQIAFADEINFSNKESLESDKINFQNITMKNGLSSNVITCIF